jgi:hypothetical protein
VKKLMMALMPNCREVAKVLSGDGLAPEPWPLRLMIRLHLKQCEFCARFARQMDRIGEALKSSWSEPAGDDVETFKRRVIKRLSSP